MDKNILNEQKINWELSYGSGDNHLFFPNEEYVRILAKYVAKLEMNGTVQYKSEFCSRSKVLDFGCGAGRHLHLLYRLGFLPIGCDISQTALKTAKHYLSSNGYNDPSLVEINSEFSFETYWGLDLIIACSVLDSMYYSIARRYFQQIIQSLKEGGIIVFDLICNEKDTFEEILVKTNHEKGTTQTYYNLEKINEMLQSKVEIIENFKVTTHCEFSMKTSSRRYLVGKKL